MLIHQVGPWVPNFIQSCENNKNEKQNFVPFQFATTEAASNKIPRVRTVVFRDFLFSDKNTNILTFNTDTRSKKCINYNETEDNLFECCFYFSETWEQYRFSGEYFIINSQTFQNQLPHRMQKKYGIPFDSKTIPVSPETDDDNKTHNDNINDDTTENSMKNEIERQWKLLSRSSRAQYRKPEPGVPITEESSKKLDKIQRGVDGAKEDAGFENFAVVCLCVDEVDYVNLKNDRGLGGERWLYKRLIEKNEAGRNIETWDEEEVTP